jgi:hypothetical protein
VAKANDALRQRASLKSEAERVAREGTTLSQFVNVAVAEKLSALRTADCFKERAVRAYVDKALALLDRAGDEAAPGREKPRQSRRSGSAVRGRR